MLATATATAQVTPLFKPDRNQLHPIAERMLDVILANAADAHPTMEGDFAEFTQAEINDHFHAAKAAAMKLTVRQLDDGRGFETHSQLLQRLTASLLRKMPTEADLHLALRHQGLGNAEIAQLWPEVIAITADAFASLHGQGPVEVQ